MAEPALEKTPRYTSLSTTDRGRNGLKMGAVLSRGARRNPRTYLDFECP